MTTKHFHLILLSFLMALTGLACSSNSRRKTDDQTKGESLHSAPKKANTYYNLFRQALDERKNGNRDKAREILVRALPEAVFGPEIAMVHHELAEMYMEENDLKNELISREQIAKYTANPSVRDESIQRANEIKMQLKIRGQVSS